MSVGTREQILTQILKDLNAIKGLTAQRAYANVPAQLRPVAVLMDGSEEAIVEDVRPGGKAGIIVRMLPTIDVAAGDDLATLPSAINSLLDKIINKILTDPLFDPRQTTCLLGAAGRVNYLGAETRFTSSFVADCDLTVRFAFYRTLKPTA